MSRFSLPAELDPSGEQAQQWVQAELARSEYHDSRSLLARLLGWVQDQIAALQEGQTGPGVSLPPIALALVAVVLVAAVGYLLTKVRVEQRTLAERRSVLGDSVATAETLRREGAAALEQGRYPDTVLAYTRAIARQGADRTLLTDAPSLTAHEVGMQLARAFPGHAAAIRRSMDLFDAVAYGGLDPSRADAESVRDTEETLRLTRPELPAPPSVGAGQLGEPEQLGASLWRTGAPS